jgi:hypothetical protein
MERRKIPDNCRTTNRFSWRLIIKLMEAPGCPQAHATRAKTPARGTQNEAIQPIPTRNT